MIKRILWLVVVLVLTLPLSVLAAEPGNGTIKGQLVNGTKGGMAKVGGVEITLTTYQNDKELGTKTTTGDAEGKFTFSGLVTQEGYSYLVKVLFLTAEYTSEPIMFKASETTQTLKMTVYDATGSDEAIKVAIEHTVIYPAPDGLQVEKYYMFTNDSDRAFIGAKEVAPDKKETLKFSLPKDAVGAPQYLTGLMECCVYGSPGGFVDSMAVIPGTRELAYSYRLPYGSAQRAIADEVKYPTRRYEVLVRGEGIQVSSSQLTNAGPTNIKGVQYQRFSGGSFNPGDTLSVQLSGLPQNSPGVVGWVIPTLVVLVGGSGIGYWMRRRSAQQPVRARSAPAAGNLAQRKQKLLMELARLDDDFEAGQIAEDVYRRSRAQRKAELVGLMAKEK